jgi:FkbM family methyltransferase
MAEQFISFAQNYEDVILWRALKHIDQGFYIDVGAYSPVEHSVTKAFYDRGWSGINIEPHPDYFRDLLTARTRDLNLNIAIGERGETRTIAFVNETGLSTLDSNQAEQRALEGFIVVGGNVRVETLASIWNDHVAPDQPVHFLKVDVEGFERQVLLGNRWDVNRPWIVVVEATRPMTMEPSFDDWESILMSADYQFVYEDGLNRFYLALEHQDLAVTLDYPPNHFDGFIRASEAQATERAVVAEARAAAVEAQATERVLVAEARAAAVEAKLTAIKQTRSWRITTPLRAATRLTARLPRPFRRQ